MSKRILIKRGGGIGDLLMLTPALSQLRKQGHEIFVRCDYPEVLWDNSDIAKINHHQHEDQFGAVYDLNGAVEPNSIMVSPNACTDEEYLNIPRIDLWCNKLGVSIPDPVKTKYHVRIPERDTILSMLRCLWRPIIVYIVNCTSPFRTYPIELGMEAMRTLSADYDVVLAGDHGLWGLDHKFTISKKEMVKDTDILDLSCKELFGIRLIGALIEQSSLVITSDTGPLHMAAALDKPTIGLFGNVDPMTRCNYYPKTTCLFKRPACFCGDRLLKADCPSRMEIRKGQIGAECMRTISPMEIVNAARKILE